MKVCSVEQMRACDVASSEEFGISSIVLMENAAIACSAEAEKFSDIAVVCGKGNNGGDGFAAARHLINKGKKVKVYMLSNDGFSADALTNYNILKKMDADIVYINDVQKFADEIHNTECIIDAIFGTGIHGKIEGCAADVIKAVNESDAYVISADIPSGINADTGEVCGCAVRADKTVTFAAYKTGLLMYPGADYAGEIVVADISIPKCLVEKSTVSVHDEKYFTEIMPKRSRNSQKGNYGKILIIGGSKGMAGAVYLACSAAFKTGAGIVTACVPEEINEILQTSVPNVMTFPVDFEKDTEKIIQKLSGFDVILFGNGIGRADFVPILLEKVLNAAKVPVVIDADGLFALSKNTKMMKNSECDIILTPHAMEMARLLKISVSEVEKDRIVVSKSFVSYPRLTLVLKGNHTIITAPFGAQSINVTGNSGMATAGSGDVLAGMTAALAAVMPTDKAAELAVYLHGKAGDRAAEKLSEYSVTAQDIIDSISHILPLENIREI